MDPRALLRRLFDTAVAAADPYDATCAALVTRLATRTDDGRGWIVALGKASVRMAEAARRAASDTDLELAGGIVVGADAATADSPLEFTVGDHPIPGARSLRAAQRLGALTQAVLPDDHVLLLISGGTTSLVAAPCDGMAPISLSTLFGTLLGAGGDVDINVMNTVRRRFLQWGGGRLAAAVAPARVHQVLLSDVVGDDPASIGSGPAVPDPATAGDVLSVLQANQLTERIDAQCVGYLREVASGTRPETPKPGDDVFRRVDPPIVLGRTMLHNGIERAVRTTGITLYVHEEPLEGEARVTGVALARGLAQSGGAGVHCWSGETIVTLDATSGRGGRCQELSLAAALELERLGDSRVTLLAAGTDGRDGPTDAAGAIVDSTVPALARARGTDAIDALARHDSHAALDAADALLKTGHTGTNVADVVIALVG
jgi:hydroxypyruvate reductase